MDAEELKARRDALGMSQPKLAEALGVHPMTVSKWERGIARVPPFLAVALDGLACREKQRRRPRHPAGPDGVGGE